MKSAVGSINRSRDRLQVSSGVLLPTNVTDDLALSGIYRLWLSRWLLPTSFSAQPRTTCIPRRCKEKKSVDTSWEELSRRVKLMDGGGCRRKIFSCLCRVGMLCHLAILVKKMVCPSFSTRPTASFKIFCPAVGHAHPLRW